MTEVQRALLSCGIGEPSLSEFADDPIVTPDLIKRVIDVTSGGPGAMVNNLRAAVACERDGIPYEPGGEVGDFCTEIASLGEAEPTGEVDVPFD